MIITKLRVTDTITGAEYEFKSWRAMAEWVVANSDKWDTAVLLPSCNNWNLLYWDGKLTVDEYAAELVDYAIGLQLI